MPSTAPITDKPHFPPPVSTKNNPKQNKNPMATVSHCHYCFDTLAAHLEHRKALTLPQIESLYREQQQQQQNGTTNGYAAPPRPLFVTWSKLSRSGVRNLRGCIGTFDAQPLETGLRSYALTAFVVSFFFSLGFSGCSGLC